MVVNHNKFEILLRDEKLADVELNPNGELGTLKITQYVEGIFRQFQKPDEEVTNQDFHKWLEWRTFPPERFGLDGLLEELGIPQYSRLAIIKKTHAVMGHDDIWIRFDGEELTFKDVSLKNI